MLIGSIRSIKRLSVAAIAWVTVISPAIVHARHHPAHGATNGQAALWIFLVIIAFIGIMGWLTRKKK
jgi:LPXTG-motif cell wall-anchored protein